MVNRNARVSDAPADAQAQAPGSADRLPAPTPRGPYLKVFGPDTGALELDLTKSRLTIGRSDEADVVLPDPSVSRIHARITLRDGYYLLEDADSKHGLTVNEEPTQRRVLEHGDSIQISSYVLQFRTHAGLAGAAAAAAHAKALLHADFALPPSTMRLKYRVLSATAEDLFRRGDTLRIGQGGLLIPVLAAPGECTCVELHVFWPNRVSKRYLGEVLGVLAEGGMHWMCVKLHAVTKNVHESVVANGQPGPWIDVPAA